MIRLRQNIYDKWMVVIEDKETDFYLYLSYAGLDAWVDNIVGVDVI